MKKLHSECSDELKKRCTIGMCIMLGLFTVVMQTLNPSRLGLLFVAFSNAFWGFLLAMHLFEK